MFNKNKEIKDINFNESSKEQIKKYLNDEYIALSKKIFNSKLMFISLNLLSILMSTFIVILTLFILGKSIGGEEIKIIFIVISILGSLTTFITGVDSIFRFKQRKEIYLKRIEELQDIVKYINEESNNNDLEKIIIRISEKYDELEEDKFV